MTNKEKILKILYVVFLFLLSVGLIYWGLNGGGFWPLIISIFLILIFVANFLSVWHEFKTGVRDNDAFLAIHLGVGFMFLVVLVVAVWIFDLTDTRYITSHGNRLHILADCSSIQSSNDVREISRLEGWFHWTFRDCKVCTDIIEKQKEAERKAKRLKKAESTRQELIDYFEQKIEEMQETLETLKSTDDPDEIYEAERLMEDLEYSGGDEDNYEPEFRGRPDRF